MRWAAAARCEKKSQLDTKSERSLSSFWMWCFHFIKLIALLLFSFSPPHNRKKNRPRMKTIKPTTMTMTFLIFSLTCLIAGVFGQSNYAQHGTNINYIGTGLPEETLLDGKVSSSWILCVGETSLVKWMSELIRWLIDTFHFSPQKST